MTWSPFDHVIYNCHSLLYSSNLSTLLFIQSYKINNICLYVFKSYLYRITKRIKISEKKTRILIFKTHTNESNQPIEHSCCVIDLFYLLHFFGTHVICSCHFSPFLLPAVFHITYLFILLILGEIATHNNASFKARNV